MISYVILALALVVVGAIVWFKIIRWHWLRDPTADRWLAARAVEEMTGPGGYLSDVEEFLSIPIRKDPELLRIQQSMEKFFKENENFVAPPERGNEYPELSQLGQERVREIARKIERELPEYTVGTSIRSHQNE